MELTLNIDEKRFTELLNNELENFTQQELHNICREGLLKCLSNEETFRHLFVDKGTRDYWGSSEKYYANDILKTAAREVNLEPLFKDFQDQVIKYLHDNHDNIIKELMIEIFTSGFSNYLYNSEFVSRMKCEFTAQMNNCLNNN